MRCWITVFCILAAGVLSSCAAATLPAPETASGTSPVSVSSSVPELVLPYVISSNSVTQKDGAALRVELELVRGNYFDDKSPDYLPGGGVYEENYQGDYRLVVYQQPDGDMLAELPVDFGGGELNFDGTFPLVFDDYNQDESLDFTLGQWSGSNGNAYKLYTIRGDEIKQLDCGGDIYAASQDFSIQLEKSSPLAFRCMAYDNAKGALVERFYMWQVGSFRQMEAFAGPTGDPLKDAELMYALRGELQNGSLSPKTRDRLLAGGIEATLAVDRLALEGATGFTLPLLLKNGEKTLEIPIKGSCSYEFNMYSQCVNLNVEWGGVCAVEDGVVAVCNVDVVSFYRIDDLTPLEFELDLSSFSENELFVAGVRYDERFGYIVPMSVDGDDYMAFFDRSGALTGLHEIGFDPNSKLFTGSHRPATGEAGRIFCGMIDVIPLDVPAIILSRYDSETIFYRNDDHMARVADKTFSHTEGSRRFELWNYDLWFTATPAPEKSHNRMALYYEEDWLKGYLYFNGDDIHPSWGSKQPLTITANPKEPVVQAVCDFTKLTLTLDFIRNEARMEYRYTPQDFADDPEQPYAVSPDGRYEIRTAAMDGGGDVLYGALVLHDTKTDAVKFLTVHMPLADILFAGADVIAVNSFDQVNLFGVTDAKRLDYTLDFDYDGDGAKTGEVQYLSVGLAYDEKNKRYLLPYRVNDWEADRQPLHLAVFDRKGKQVKDFDTGLSIPTRYKNNAVGVQMTLDGKGNVAFATVSETIGTVPYL